MNKNKFTQFHVGDYLKRCTTEDEMVEVFGGYIYVKYARGANTQQVLRKLHLLACYLKSTGCADMLRTHPYALSSAAYHVQHLHGGAIGAVPTKTAIGNEAWNHVRRICYKPPKAPRRTPGLAPAIEARLLHWGQIGPAPVMKMSKAVKRRAGLTNDQVIRIVSLEPDEVAMIGRRPPAEYLSVILPAYDDIEGDDIVLRGVDPISEEEDEDEETAREREEQVVVVAVAA